LILSKNKIEDILRYSISEPHIIRASYGTRIINPESITWESSEDNEEDEFSKGEPVINYLDKIFDTTPDNIKKQYHSQIGGRIVVTDSATSGHDIANQWGAFRMAQIAELDMSEFSHPKTLYFKYLLANIGLKNELNPSNCEPFHEGDLNILFIDDNFDKGWSECLEKLFIKNIIKKGNVVINSSTKLEISHLKNITCDTYNLIILDYYLQDGEIGIRLLKKIKENNPVIPVIMFTASNKAWNMDELYEAGADGYYVKEHPETANDPEFSVKNFQNFHKTVENCLKKGTLLRKYWKKINEIENSTFIKNKSGQKNKE
jgi:DNA-binding NarL/FixJ family response regulator